MKENRYPEKARVFLLHINNSNICGANMQSTDPSSLHIYFLQVDFWQFCDCYMDGERRSEHLAWLQAALVEASETVTSK